MCFNTYKLKQDVLNVLLRPQTENMLDVLNVL